MLINKMLQQNNVAKQEPTEEVIKENIQDTVKEVAKEVIEAKPKRKRTRKPKATKVEEPKVESSKTEVKIDAKVEGEFNEPNNNGQMMKQLGYFPESIWYVPVDYTLKNLTETNVANSQNKDKRAGMFNALMAKRLIEFYTEKGETVLDPFGDWGIPAMIASNLDRKGIFMEIVPGYYNEIMANINVKENPVQTQGILGDAHNIPMTDASVDYIITAPPTWNIEKHESVTGQLTDIKDYDKFLEELKNVFKECYRVLKPGHYMTVVVADFRRDWKLYGYHMDAIEKASEVGLEWHDIIINKQRNLGAMLAVKKCVEREYMLKIHEYVLTFKKPE